MLAHNDHKSLPLSLFRSFFSPVFPFPFIRYLKMADKLTPLADYVCDVQGRHHQYLQKSTDTEDALKPSLTHSFEPKKLLGVGVMMVLLLLLDSARFRS